MFGSTNRKHFLLRLVPFFKLKYKNLAVYSFNLFHDRIFLVLYYCKLWASTNVTGYLKTIMQLLGSHPTALLVHSLYLGKPVMQAIILLRPNLLVVRVLLVHKQGNPYLEEPQLVFLERLNLRHPFPLLQPLVLHHLRLLEVLHLLLEHLLPLLLGARHQLLVVSKVYGFSSSFKINSLIYPYLFLVSGISPKPL